MKQIILFFLSIAFYFATIAQNVGIGTITPTAQLDVSGTLRFEKNGEALGNVLIADDLGNATWSKLTRPEIYSVNSSAFQPTVSSDILVRTSGQGGVTYYTAPASATSIVAPVNLPQGASITEVTFYFLDNSAEDLSLVFGAEYLDFGSFTFLATASTSGTSPDWRSVTVIPPSPIIINNTNQSYYVSAYGVWPGTFDLAIKGVRIKYTYVVNN